MRSGAFKNLCHIQIYTVKWTYEPIWESIFSVFWASGVLKSIFPDLSAPKEARETKKIHLKFFIQKGLPPTWETTVGRGGGGPIQSNFFHVDSWPQQCWWALLIEQAWVWSNPKDFNNADWAGPISTWSSRLSSLSFWCSPSTSTSSTTSGISRFSDARF